MLHILSRSYFVSDQVKVFETMAFIKAKRIEQKLESISYKACISVYFSINQSQLCISPLGQLQSTSCSPLIGLFKFQALIVTLPKENIRPHPGEHPVFPLIS